MARPSAGRVGALADARPCLRRGVRGILTGCAGGHLLPRPPMPPRLLAATTVLSPRGAQRSRALKEESDPAKTSTMESEQVVRRRRESQEGVHDRPHPDQARPSTTGAPRSLKDRASDLVREVLGVEPAPELLAIAMVYFVQGILGLSRLAVSFYFKDDLHLEPADVALLGGLAGIPWAIKPIYGFISDSLPLFGYKRRSYLIACGFLGASAWLLLSTGPTQLPIALLCTVGGSLSTAFSDVVVDSLVVERARGTPVSTAGSLQSLCWASSAVGAIISAYFSGFLVEAYGPRAVFSVTAAFPLITAGASALIDETPVRRTSNPAGPASADLAPAGAPSALAGIRDNASRLWHAVKEQGILYPALFLFIWQATPSSGSAMFYFYTNELGFSPEFLGRVALVGAVSNLAGVGIYNRFLKKVPLRSIFLGTAILGAVLSSTQLLLITRANLSLGLSDELFVLGDSVVLTVLGQLSFLPILVLAARICPEGVEATLFATLMSLLNSGTFAGSALGAGLTKALGVTSSNFDNLATLVALCCVGQLLPLPLLRLVPANLNAPDQGAPGEGSGGKGAKGSDQC